MGLSRLDYFDQFRLCRRSAAERGMDFRPQIAVVLPVLRAVSQRAFSFAGIGANNAPRVGFFLKNRAALDACGGPSVRGK
jgi:hypothetical protein